MDNGRCVGEGQGEGWSVCLSLMAGEGDEEGGLESGVWSC